MSLRSANLSIFLFILCLALCSGSAFAVVNVPIINPDFEADQLPSEGSDQPTIIGWDTTAGGGDGIFRPTPSDYPSAIPSGENVAYVNLSGNRVRQVLSTPLAPNTTYVLKVAVGWNGNDPFAGYRVELQAGGDILAQDVSSQMPSQGGWVTSIVTYTSGANPMQIGEPLEIWLRSPGIQANYDSAALQSYAANRTVCTDSLLLPFFVVDTDDPDGTDTFVAIRNLTGDEITADLEYFTPDGTSQAVSALTLEPYETETVSLRTVQGLAADPDGLAQGFLRAVTVGNPDGTPVLGGDFFLVDGANDFATGNRLLRQSGLCREASIRFLDFGAGTRLTVFVTNPRGDDPGQDPHSFTVQVLTEAGAPMGSPQPVWTAEHAVELAASDFTGSSFGILQFDFENGQGGAAYAEYSAQGRFSVGLAAQCDGARPCSETDCCPPGTPKALAAGLHFPAGSFPQSCEAVTADALTDLDSFHYRNACQEAHGGPLPDEVLGARVVDCRVDPPLSEDNVVVAVEVCCPLP